MMEEGSGIKTLAQQFFEDLACHATDIDVPPEKSDQTIRIKLSTTPWVVPTAVDRRFGISDGSETIIPKLQRLNPAAAASATSPFAGISPVRSPYGGPSPSSSSSSTSGSQKISSGQLDPFVAFRPTSHDADRFDMPVRINEDPSILPIQPPAPVQEDLKPTAPATGTASFLQQPVPSRPIVATPGKQIFLKSPPPPDTGAAKQATPVTPAPSLFFSPKQPQSILLSPTRLSTAFPQPPPSSTRKRVTFSTSAEEPSRGTRDLNNNKPAPIQRTFLSPSAPGSADYRYASPY